MIGTTMHHKQFPNGDFSHKYDKRWIEQNELKTAIKINLINAYLFTIILLADFFLTC